MIVYVMLYLVLVLWIMYLLKVPPFGTELFTQNSPNFIESADKDATSQKELTFVLLNIGLFANNVTYPN